MELSTLPTLDSGENIGSSNPNPRNQKLDLGSGILHTLNTPAPGMWQFPKNPDLCCIYRVPNCMRQVNPEAYTPQLVIIGPLHHSLKSQALKSHGDITNTKSMGYLNMERHKKVYLEMLAQEVIDGFRKIIEEEEGMIRASYSESTAWIDSSEFMEMILLDCVFILVFIFKSSNKYSDYSDVKTGDPLIDESCLEHVVKRDLILLENQIPYFLFKRFSDFYPIFPNLHQSVMDFFFGYGTIIKDSSNFRHFTDLLRCARVDTLPEQFFGCLYNFDPIYNADKLHSGGVKFDVVNENFSLKVEFKNGCLNIPFFQVHDHSETTFRNIMALEQCHYSYNTHVCNYILFMHFLIETRKDVELLVVKGIILNGIGSHGSVAAMVNKLSLGISNYGSYYSIIAREVQNHYDDPWNKSRTILKSVYFSNPWRGTATVAL